MGSNPVYSKSVKSVCTKKKFSHCSSLFQYNYLSKNHSFIFLCKNFLLQKQYHPIPHPVVPFICACSMPQHRKKYSTSKDYLSLLVYLYLLVYEESCLSTFGNGITPYSRDNLHKVRLEMLSYFLINWCSSSYSWAHLRQFRKFLYCNFASSANS